MRVLFDHQIFWIQRYGGISRYFTELMQQYRDSGKVQWLLSPLFSDNENLSPIPDIVCFPDGSRFLPWGGKRFILAPLALFNNISSINTLKSNSYDIFHPTYYNPYFLRYLGNKPFILSVYDLIHEKFPEYSPPRTQKIVKTKEKLILSADQIITISDHTKHDLLEWYDIEPDRVTTIHLGVSQGIGNIGNKDPFPYRYILYVGFRSRYKNFERLLHAFSRVVIQDSNIYLVCAGGGNFSLKEKGLMKDLQIFNRVHYVPVERDIPGDLYQFAELFVFPSLYEGFGLPIVDAFVNRCPVALSRSSSFPEVARDAAVYFDPLSVESIAEAMNKVIFDEVYRATLIEKGLQRATHFSWNKTAQETQEVYARSFE